MKVNDGLAARGGFEEGEVIGIVVEKVLAECGGIDVDGDQADVSFAQLTAPGVDALDAGAVRGRGGRHRSRSISIAGRWRRRFAGCSSIRGSGGPGSICRGCWIKRV